MRWLKSVVWWLAAAGACLGAEEPWQGKWIWIAGPESPRNFYAAARKVFTVAEGATLPELRITADTRYIAYVNGVCVGRGPIRSWPAQYHYDTYDLTGILRPGVNAVGVLVKHFGISTFQVIAARGGLLAEVRWNDGGERRVVGTDATWEVMSHPAFSRRTPRIACQQGWVEHFDARKDPVGWLAGADVAAPLGETAVVGPAGCEPWTRLIRRPIPQLTLEPVYPVRVIRERLVLPPAGTWALDLRPNLIPADREANPQPLCGLLVTTVEVPDDTGVVFHHRTAWTGVNGKLRVNGIDAGPIDDPWASWLGGFNLAFTLKKGANLLVWDVTGNYHEWSLNLGMTSPRPLLPRAPFFEGSSFATYGPFPSQNDAAFRAVWDARSVEDLTRTEKLRAVSEEHVYEPHVFHLVAWAREGKDPPSIANLGAICAAHREPIAIAPPPAGHDVEFVLDFGRMTVGYIEFAVEAPEGAILDFLGFEGMQEEKWQLPAEMANVCRYTCREGYQEFTSTDRRGFRYLIVTARNFTKPIRLFSIRTLLNTYPVVERGDFHSSDDRLNAIWRMGRYTTRLCSEDTFVDCPTYEQTFWVGDARNEGAVNLIAFGEYELSRHCLLLAAASLGRSPVVESQVPSGWLRILPAWSLLWALACEEYYQAAGDLSFVHEIYPSLKKQAEGFATMRDAKGLLAINAWNMLDWAGMDTPDDGIVTHQNAWYVASLRRTARLARILGKDDEAALYLRWASELTEAINRHLWNEQKKAYVDCIRAGGMLSPVISQQTNVVVYLTDCATPERKRLIAEYVKAAPPDFVKVGSPFMMFFVFEALADLGEFQRILDLVRTEWGFMLDHGATTCWETFPSAGWPYWTRSHCHAWSSAPTYFLSAYQLGIRPLGPGFRTALIAPVPADLAWARGMVPTPHGTISVSWRKEPEGFRLDAEVPEGVRAEVEIPPEYPPASFPRVTIRRGEPQSKIAKQQAKWVIALEGGALSVEVGK